ncbi:hypothetical protein ACJX0J_028516, partial [Zea mays]
MMKKWHGGFAIVSLFIILIFLLKNLSDRELQSLHSWNHLKQLLSHAIKEAGSKIHGQYLMIGVLKTDTTKGTLLS